jgi:hypothetical protein
MTDRLDWRDAFPDNTSELPFRRHALDWPIAMRNPLEHRRPVHLFLGRVELEGSKRQFAHRIALDCKANGCCARHNDENAP